MDRSTHIDQDTLAVFALGALEPRESRRVGMHVDQCERCRANLKGFKAAADGLLHSAPPVEPPARLRAKIIAQLSKAQPARRTSWWQRLTNLPLAPIALGLSAILLALNVGLWLQVQEVQQLEAQLLAQVNEDRIAQGLYAYPDVHRVLIEGENVYGSAIYEEYLCFAVLYVWGLEPLSEGQIYQVWLIEPDGDRVSGGLFDVEAGEEFIQAVVRAPAMIKGFDGIGVTVEPAGGSDQPTGVKVLGVDL